MFKFKYFLFENLLLEDKIKFILDKQGDKIFKAYESDKGMGKPDLKTSEEVLNYLSDNFSEKYLQWLSNRYIQGQFSLEDSQYISELLTKYEKVRSKLDKKDLNQYKSVKELEDTLAPFKKEDLKSNRQLDREREQKFFDDKEAKVFYDKAGIKVIIPKTEEASCYFGVGTKWCTAAKNNNMFDSYNKRGSLYIVFTDDGKKYQFFFKTGSNQLMDEKDYPIENWDEILKKYPALYDAFEKIAKKVGFLDLIKEPSDEDYVRAIKDDAYNTIKKAHNSNKQLPSLAVKEIVKLDKTDLISGYWKAFKKEDVFDVFKTVANNSVSHKILHVALGWLKNNHENVSKSDFEEVFNIILDHSRKNKYNTNIYGFIKQILESDHEMASMYGKWIHEQPIKVKEEIVKIDDDAIKYFEDDLSEEFKISLIKDDPNVFEKFSKPTNKMKEHHRWSIQSKDPRFKRGF